MFLICVLCSQGLRVSKNESEFLKEVGCYIVLYKTLSLPLLSSLCFECHRFSNHIVNLFTKEVCLFIQQNFAEYGLQITPTMQWLQSRQKMDKLIIALEMLTICL
jgi:hypothetical protein